MKKYWQKLVSYYEYNGLKKTIFAVLRKIFKPYNRKYLKNLEKIKNFNLEEQELDETVIKKNTKNIFIMATVPYFDVGGGQRSAQLAKTFNKLGFNVFYIYAFPCSENKIPFISVPVTYHKYIGNAPVEEIDKYVNKDDIFIFEAPTKSFRPYLEMAKSKKCKVVYENIDNWETSLGSILFDRETLKVMIKNADMIVSTAKELVKQTEKYIKEYTNDEKKVYYLANAVDDELFNPLMEYEKPTDLVMGTKTLLYYGSLWGEWFDWDIIREVASKRRDITINLIGDDKGVSEIKKTLPSNVYFLGIKKQTELPAYLKYSDFAILPFKPGKIGNSVSPLKVFEYIAMNKKVLATKLPDIIGYPNVYTLDSSKDWLKKLDEKLELTNAREFISNNNWYNRALGILDGTNKKYAKKVDKEFYNNISVVVLNYNNKNVIFRCVDTLIQNNERYKYQIVVVDNNSSDGSYEELKSKYKNKITLVRNKKNGCSSGRNLGVKNSSGDYIVFLDSDEWVLHNHWLDNYLNLINKEKVGAVAWAGGWFNNKYRAYKVTDAYEFKYMKPNMMARCDIGYLATCGFIIKRSVFNKIKGFDLKYDPTCYEDTDLSLKVRDAGLEIYYSSYLGVGHLPHQTTKSGTDAHLKLITEKGDYFIEKWCKKNKELITKYIK